MWMQGGGKLKYNITERDKLLLLQNSIKYSYKLFVVDNNKNILDELSGIQSIGNYCVNSESNIRRTTSFILYLDAIHQNSGIENKIHQWIGYHFKLQIGIFSLRENDYLWYDCGYYMITEINTTYDAVNNSIDTTLSDWYSKLDCTRNGQIGGAPTIDIPNYNDDGSPVTIKGTVENLLKSETDLTDYLIDDIGEFYGMSQNNENYLVYRENNPLWNQLPYDLKYESGCSIADILNEIVSLYPNCQMYFDIYGNFCFNMVPSCEYDPIILSNDYIQQILIGENSESVSYAVGDIKNVTEIFGANYNIDRYVTACSSNENVYTLTLDDYQRYSIYDYIAFIPDTANIQNAKVRINSLPEIPVYYEGTTNAIDSNEWSPGETYVLLIKKIQDEYVAYYLGQYQPHAICILTNNEHDAKYTKSYFAQKYNCKERNVILRVESDSPFSVQKIGEILDSRSGEEFENILSDSVARENAVYFNKKASTLKDTVTITVKMIPFLDVNTKIQYQKQQDDRIHEYIIKEINHNTESNTTTITMYRFYPLY